MIKVEIVQILISDADVWLVATAVELLVTIVSVLDLFYDGSTVHCLHNVRYIRRRTLCAICNTVNFSGIVGWRIATALIAGVSGTAASSDCAQGDCSLLAMDKTTGQITTSVHMPPQRCYSTRCETDDLCRVSSDLRNSTHNPDVKARGRGQPSNDRSEQRPDTCICSRTNKSFGGCSKHCDIHRTDRKEAYQRGNEEKASGPQLGLLRRVAAGKHFSR